MRNIFINPSTGILRAGWRMLFFTVTLAGGGMLEGFLLKTYQDKLGPSLGYIEQFFVCVIIIAASWLSLRVLEKRPLKDLGLPLQSSSLKHLGWGVLLGGSMITLIFLFESSTGMMSRTLLTHDISAIAVAGGLSLLLFAIGALGEELLFRGYLFQTLTVGTNKWIATGAFAVLFGTAHMANPSVTFFSLLNIALAGIWLSIAYYRSGALWFPFGLHFGWNFFQHWYAFPVSGGAFSSIRIFALVQSGPTWLTGGNFGPEGGALSTVVLLVTIAVLLKYDLFHTKSEVS
jgi:hypothetical protein